MREGFPCEDAGLQFGESRFLNHGLGVACLEKHSGNVSTLEKRLQGFGPVDEKKNRLSPIDHLPGDKAPVAKKFLSVPFPEKVEIHSASLGPVDHVDQIPRLFPFQESGCFQSEESGQTLPVLAETGGEVVPEGKGGTFQTGAVHRDELL